MNDVTISAGFGIIGGIVRIMVGFLKTVQIRQKINYNSLAVYGIILVIIGAFSGIILGYGKVLSFLAGYAGIDLIEGYYKTFMKKKIKV